MRAGQERLVQGYLRPADSGCSNRAGVQVFNSPALTADRKARRERVDRNASGLGWNILYERICPSVHQGLERLASPIFGSLQASVWSMYVLTFACNKISRKVV